MLEEGHMSYPLRVRKVVCVECHKEFETRSANAKRCEKCRGWNGQAYRAKVRKA